MHTFHSVLVQLHTAAMETVNQSTATLHRWQSTMCALSTLLAKRPLNHQIPHQ